MNESYVERWVREQKEAAQKAQKCRKSQKVKKEVQENGKDTRSEGHEAQAESNGRYEAV